MAWLTMLAQVTEGSATLDHIFIKSSEDVRWRVAKKSVVRVDDERGLSVSDHFGLSVTLEEKVRAAAGSSVSVAGWQAVRQQAVA